MFDITLAFITAFTLTFFAIPSIILVSKKKRLFDEPGKRRAHVVSTPSLGGIAIYAGVVFSVIMWTPFSFFVDLQYILAAYILIFLIGAKDDIVPMDAWKKLVGELLAALILVFKSNVKIDNFYGIFGVYELPDYAAIPLTIFVILLIINAFNLIDGINGLSGSISLLICFLFGTWFFLTDNLELAIIAFATIGAVAAFLKYNFSPAKIFMGDTGSLFLGLTCSVLAIKFIQINAVIPNSIYYFPSAPIITIAILILPLFDTFRVFVKRILKGTSPFSPDKNHLHHMLLASGFSHMQSMGILVLGNICFVVLAWNLRSLPPLVLLMIIFVLASALSYLLFRHSRKKNLAQ